MLLMFLLGFYPGDEFTLPDYGCIKTALKEKDRKNWNEAKLDCESYNRTLLTIDLSTGISQMIMDIINDLGKIYFVPFFLFIKVALLAILTRLINSRLN